MPARYSRQPACERLRLAAQSHSSPLHLLRRCRNRTLCACRRGACPACQFQQAAKAASALLPKGFGWQFTGTGTAALCPEDGLTFAFNAIAALLLTARPPYALALWQDSTCLWLTATGSSPKAADPAAAPYCMPLAAALRRRGRPLLWYTQKGRLTLALPLPYGSHTAAAPAITAKALLQDRFSPLYSQLEGVWAGAYGKGD